MHAAFRTIALSTGPSLGHKTIEDILEWAVPRDLRDGHSASMVTRYWDSKGYPRVTGGEALKGSQAYPRKRLVRSA